MKFKRINLDNIKIPTSQKGLQKYIAQLLVMNCVKFKKDLILEKQKSKCYSDLYLTDSSGKREPLIPIPSPINKGVLKELENLICNGQDIYTFFCGENQTIRIHKDYKDSYKKIKLENLTI